MVARQGGRGWHRGKTVAKGDVVYGHYFLPVRSKVIAAITLLQGANTLTVTGHTAF